MPTPTRKVYTEDEAKELLAGYHEIEDKAKWSEISSGSHIRYYDETGEFRFGGIMRDNRLGNAEGTKRFMRIEAMFGQKRSWTVGIEKITRLFVKYGATDNLRSQVDEAIRKLNSNVQALAKRSNEQDAHVKALEAQIKAQDARIAALERAK